MQAQRWPKGHLPMTDLNLYIQKGGFSMSWKVKGVFFLGLGFATLIFSAPSPGLASISNEREMGPGRGVLTGLGDQSGQGAFLIARGGNGGGRWSNTNGSGQGRGSGARDGSGVGTRAQDGTGSGSKNGSGSGTCDGTGPKGKGRGGR